MATKKRTEGAVTGYGTRIEFLGFGFIGYGNNFRGSRGGIETAEITNFDSPQPEGDNEFGGSEHVATFSAPATLSLTVVWTADYKLPPQGAQSDVRVTFPLAQGFKTSRIWFGNAILLSVDVSAETRTPYSAEITIQRNGVWSDTPATRNAP